MKRIITFTMDIDTEKHESENSVVVTEDGIEKTEWKVAEAMSVISVLSNYIKDLAQHGAEFLIKLLDEEQK